MNNPFVHNFEELFSNITNDIKEEGKTSLYIAADKPLSIFKKVLVQELVRDIDGKTVKFIAVRDIALKEKFKGQKLFTNFVKQLQQLKKPIIYHDVVNPRLIAFFQQQGYQLFQDQKYEQTITSMYKLFKD